MDEVSDETAFTHNRIAILSFQSIKRPGSPLGPKLLKRRQKEPQGSEAVGQGIHKTLGSTEWIFWKHQCYRWLGYKFKMQSLY